MFLFYNIINKVLLRYHLVSGSWNFAVVLRKEHFMLTMNGNRNQMVLIHLQRVADRTIVIIEKSN